MKRSRKVGKEPGFLKIILVCFLISGCGVSSKKENALDQGMLYLKNGKSPEAIRSFKKAIRLDPGFADAHYYLGLTYKDLGQTKLALDKFKDILLSKMAKG